METLFPNRRWLIIPATLAEILNFDQIYESSSSSLRYSVDGTKTFIKYEINEVTESYIVTVPNIENPGQDHTYTVEAGIYGRPSFYSEEYPEYNHEEILAILATEEWTPSGSINNENI
jgi:hypothetical protein